MGQLQLVFYLLCISLVFIYIQELLVEQTSLLQSEKSGNKSQNPFPEYMIPLDVPTLPSTTPSPTSSNTPTLSPSSSKTATPSASTFHYDATQLSQHDLEWMFLDQFQDGRELFVNISNRAKEANVKITEEFEIDFLENETPFRISYRREFEYPPFVLPFPNFVSKDDYEFFAKWKEVKENYNTFLVCQSEQNELCQDFVYGVAYLNESAETHLKGSVSVVKDVSFGCTSHCGRVDCSGRCLGYCGYHSWEKEHWWFNKPVINATHETNVVYMEIPESWAFQHWLPDLYPKLIQLFDMAMNPNTKILTAKPQSSSPMVKYLWEYFDQYDSLIFLENGRKKIYHADNFIFGCHAPAVHPFLWKEMRIQLGVRDKEANKLKKIIWLGRKKETAKNGGRVIVNENEVLFALEKVANRTGLEFEFFDHRNYPSVEETAKLFGEARIIIGPHGGAMFNQLFVSANGAVIEIFPRELYGAVGGNIIVWLQSVLADQEYWRLHSPSQNRGNKIYVQVHELVNTVLSSILDLDFTDLELISTSPSPSFTPSSSNSPSPSVTPSVSTSPTPSSSLSLSRSPVEFEVQSEKTSFVEAPSFIAEETENTAIIGQKFLETEKITLLVEEMENSSFTAKTENEKPHTSFLKN